MQFTLHSRPYCVLMRSIPRNKLPIAKVLDYWEEMKQLNVPLDAAAYTSIIAAHSDSNLLHNALEYFKQFLATKQQPTMEMFSTLIVINGKLKNISAMEKLYHRATGYSKRLTKSMSMMLLDSLITGYSYGGEWQKALIIWNRLRGQIKLKQNPDPPPIIKSAMPDIFMHVASQMTLETFGVDTVTICVILDALGKAQRLSEVEMVWKDVRDSNMPLVLNNITSYVEALLRCEQYDQGLQVVLNLEKEFGIKPDKKLLLNTATLMPRDKYHSTVDVLKQKYPDIEVIYPPDIRHASKKVKLQANQNQGLTVDQLEKELRLKNGVWLLPPMKFN